MLCGQLVEAEAWVEVLIRLKEGSSCRVELTSGSSGSAGADEHVSPRHVD